MPRLFRGQWWGQLERQILSLNVPGGAEENHEKLVKLYKHSQHECLISLFRGKQAKLLLSGNFRKRKRSERGSGWIVRYAIFSGLKVPRNSSLRLLVKCGSMRR